VVGGGRWRQEDHKVEGSLGYIDPGQPGPQVCICTYIFIYKYMSKFNKIGVRIECCKVRKKGH
jgi:hypothetical protein